MTRIAMAGFQHETNTFAPGSAGTEEFFMADSWPGLLRGRDLLTGTAGMNLPIAGAVGAARAAGVEIVPILWCAAEPCGHVSDDAFEHICGLILDGLRGAGPLDGVYLDLHGAMVTASHDDGEGELLARARALLGAALPIGVSLDLHANISARMARLATVCSVYRTYPHLDMAATGARCVARLLRVIGGEPVYGALRQAPYLIPLHAQFTGVEPCRSLYADVAEIDREPDQTADLALGFTAADIRDCGPAVLAYAITQTRADALAERLLDRVVAAEAAFDTALVPADDAVRTALQAPPGRPVVIADVQDNPGAGATSDTTGLLRALVDQRAANALLGLMHDPAIAARAHRAGVGGVIDGALGGRSGVAGDTPFHGRFRVAALSDGRVAYTGRMYGGGTAEIGPCALLQILDRGADVRVAVSSLRSQCLDRALFTQLGAEPADFGIVCVKSTVHFRADFDAIAGAVSYAAAPGAFPCRLERVPYRRLRPGVRLGPGGPAFRTR